MKTKQRRKQTPKNKDEKDSVKAIIRKIIVTLVGGILLLIGLASFFFPTPAVIILPAALIILATEFVIVRRLIKSLRAHLNKRYCKNHPDSVFCKKMNNVLEKAEHKEIN